MSDFVSDSFVKTRKPHSEEDSFRYLAHDVVRALSASACGYFGVSSGKCSMCPASTRGYLCVGVMLDDVDSRLRALEHQAERDRHDDWEQLEDDARLDCCEYFGKQTWRDCGDCPGYYDGICRGNRAMSSDLVRRAKALAGVE